MEALAAKKKKSPEKSLVNHKRDPPSTPKETIFLEKADCLLPFMPTDKNAMASKAELLFKEF